MYLSQQTTTLSPFMWKFIAFFQVTCGASKHKIRWIIRSPATQWNNMFYVVRSLLVFELIAAVVTATALLFQHTLDVLRGKAPFGVYFASAPSNFAHQSNHFSSRGLSIAFGSHPPIFWVCLIPSRGALRHFLSCSYMIWDRIFRFTRLAPYLAIVCLTSSPSAFSAVRREPVCARATRIKKFRGWQKVTIALAATLFAVNISLTRLTSFSYASLTSWSQTISLLIVFIEKFRGCWVFLRTINTAFQGDLRRFIHDNLNCLSSSRLVLFVRQGNKAITFSHREATPMLDGHLILPFFLARQKAEV